MRDAKPDVTDDAQMLLIAPPLRQLGTTEGNVGDWPFFELSAKRTNPKVDVAGLSNDAATAKITAAYTQTVSIFRGRTQQTFVKTASSAFGYPGDLAQRIFYLLVGLWSIQNRPNDPRVYVSRHQICRSLEISVGGNTFKDIERALDAMSSLVVSMTNAWKIRQTNSHHKQTVSGVRTAKLIQTYNFKPERLGTRVPSYDSYAQILRDHDASGAQGAPKDLPWVLLGTEVHESIRGGYIIPADNAYANALTPTGRRAYYLFNKWKGHERSVMSVSLDKLAALLPIHQDRPAARERVAEAALAQLTKETMVGTRRVRFLSRYEWSGVRGTRSRKVSFWYEGRNALAAVRRKLLGGATAAEDAEADDGLDDDESTVVIY